MRVLNKIYQKMMVQQSFFKFSTKIDMNLIKQLREITGSPIGLCKTALEQNNGDIDKAKDYLTEKGLASASKKIGKETREGLIGLSFNQARTKAVLAEFNCETDFVAKTDLFQKFVQQFLASALLINYNQKIEKYQEKEQIENFLKNNSFQSNLIIDGQKLDSSIEETKRLFISRLQENLNIKRFIVLQAEQNKQVIGQYVHNSQSPGIGYSGCLTILNSSVQNEQSFQLADFLALQVLGMKPQYINRSEISEEVLKREREVAKIQLDKRIDGKSENIQKNMIEGKLKKFYEDQVLLEQELVVGEDGKKVEKYIQELEKTDNCKYSIESFHLFQLKQ